MHKTNLDGFSSVLPNILTLVNTFLLLKPASITAYPPEFSLFNQAVASTYPAYNSQEVKEAILKYW
jgi:hypothetical protein